ncbi:unnamed protein product [Adineta steineri]|uniref:Peroxisomal membrane protein PEX13 n=1 Tax=Adineta steineri TaxID=433720 RepID=A0A813N4U7_9BILA|nr:unnamed protein product [Adineta steineri]CAF3477261.1 unnamed protein product [Adineta steineri]
MAAPKPWESSVPMSSQPMPTIFDTINNGMIPTIEQPRMQSQIPPPPPRTIQQQQQPMGLYQSANYLSPYSLGSYQQGGLYNNNYRYSPYNTQYGMQSNMPVSNFSQLAMDESRSAFSSIESVIHTFRSVSYMLESTFNSVYSSFRAVTDVVDNFTRIRSDIASLYPLVLLWRFFKYLYHRLLRILHLRHATRGTTEETWSAIYHSLQQTNINPNGQMPSPSSSSSSSSLLVALFFIVSFGTPMLMLRLINSIIKKRQTSTNWLEQDTNQPRVLALYDYTARNPDELSFTRGATIYLAPLALQSTSSNWFLGTVDRIHTGLIPANYVQPVRQTPNSSITLHPQTPYNATSVIPPQSSSTTTNIPQPNVHEGEQPTLS